MRTGCAKNVESKKKKKKKKKNNTKKHLSDSPRNLRQCNLQSDSRLVLCFAQTDHLFSFVHNSQ